MPLNLLLADDHRIVRQGLHELLKRESDFRLVGEAADGLEAIRLVERLKPDILVLDLMLPNLNGLEVARRTVRESPRTRVVILSMHTSESYVVAALQAGASAYVCKESSSEELVTAIRRVAAGQRYLSAAISESALHAYQQKAKGRTLDPYDTLTAREREVLQLTAEGLTGNEISARLFISPRTVETHRKHITEKLGLRNQKDIIRFAVKRGVVATEPEMRLSDSDQDPWVEGAEIPAKNT
jgi:DNA-binding NarL/FixJ family response regulator